MATSPVNLVQKLDKFLVQVEGLNVKDNEAGSGAYGVVFKVTVKGKECIAKKLHNILLKAGDYYPLDQKESIIEKFRNECHILSHLHHPNVVAFVGIHYGCDKDDISLIMERLSTDLAAFVFSHPQTTLAQRIHILYDVSKGLCYLHSLTPPLIHRDLTAPNVFLANDLTAKIGDLGVSRYVDLEALSTLLTKVPGNMYYMPPETRADNPVYTGKLDIFSFGTLIIHTFIGCVPALHDVPYTPEAIQLSKEGKIELTKRRKAIKEMTTEHCTYSLIARCLQDTPDSRPTAEELCTSLKELCNSHPTKAFQRTEIKAALGLLVKEGDIWYLVDNLWWDRWQKYVEYMEETDPCADTENVVHPGKVTNSLLLQDDGTLRKSLQNNRDYHLLSELVWTKLVTWYGLCQDSKLLPRKWVHINNRLTVEVYLPKLSLSVYPNTQKIKQRSFSRTDIVATVIQGIKEEFGIPVDVECRVHYFLNSHHRLISDPHVTLQESGLFGDSQHASTIIVLERQLDDGTWPQNCPLNVQKSEVMGALKKNLVRGDSWFLISSIWMRKWKHYVEPMDSVTEAVQEPGPVNNSNLLKDNDAELKDNLLAHADYIPVPESVWKKLCFWYGLDQQSQAIERKVVECHPLTSHCFLEVYLLEINLCVENVPTSMKKRVFSRSHTVSDIKDAVRKELDLSSDAELHLRVETLGELFSHQEQTLVDVGLLSGQTVLISSSEPSIEFQKRELRAALKQQLVAGDTWYLIGIRWMKQWKKYVGYDTWDQSSAGKDSAHPGPIDNSNLFKAGRLREHLMDELDYFLLPELAWNKLVYWFGLSSGSKIVSRCVVEYGLYMKHYKVEVYLLELGLCVHPNFDEKVKREFSRANSVDDLEMAIREEFGVPPTLKCRVWHRYMAHTYELLFRADQSLQDAGLYNGQTIVLELQNKDGSWPRTS